MGRVKGNRCASDGRYQQRQHKSPYSYEVAAVCFSGIITELSGAQKWLCSFWVRRHSHCYTLGGLYRIAYFSFLRSSRSR
jgi:hypothetical protein